jgi:hypothetical protein
MIFSLLGTLGVYLLSLVLFKSVLDFAYIWDIVTFSKILGLAVGSWLPFYLYYKSRARCFPEAHEKLDMKEEF